MERDSVPSPCPSSPLQDSKLELGKVKVPLVTAVCPAHPHHPRPPPSQTVCEPGWGRRSGVGRRPLGRRPSPGASPTLLNGEKAGPPGAPLPTTPGSLAAPHSSVKATRRPGPHTPRPNIRPRRGPDARKKINGPQSNRKPKPTRFKSKSSRQLARLPRRQAPRVADDGEPRAGPPGAPGGRLAPHARLQTRPQARAARVQPGWSGGAGEGRSSPRAPGRPGPPSPPWPPGARAQGATKVSEGRGKLRARGRAPTSCGERGQQRQAEQGRQERRHAYPAGCPLRPVAASCAGTAGLRRTGARRTVPRAVAAARGCSLLLGGRAALDPRGLGARLGAPARSSAALAPAPRAPALPPAAEALVRRRPPCAPPPPAGPAPRARPADPSAPLALTGLAPARTATALRRLGLDAHPEAGSFGVGGRGGAKGRRGPALGTTSCSKVFSGKKFGSGLRKDPALTVAFLGDNWQRFASQ